MADKLTTVRVKGDEQASARERTAASAERTRENILDIATEEFANNGLSGARVDAIAARTRTSKRMIYYYFGGKAALYKAVLERAYQGIRSEEAQWQLSDLPPKEALKRLIAVTFEYDETHRQFVQLVSIENVHRAKSLSQLKSIQGINASIIRTLDDILTRGQRTGDFRQGVSALDTHFLISAFCFFRISNRYTLEVLFNWNMLDAATRAHHLKMITEAVLAYLAVPTRGDNE